MTYEDIIEHFGGSLSKAARALDIPITTLHTWRDGVPFGRQCEIQIRTRGKLQAIEPAASNSRNKGKR